MSLFSQLFTNGVIIGAIYALVASGIALTHHTCKFVNFAHGAVATFAAYITFFLFSRLGLNFGLAVILTLIFASGLGWLINLLFFKPLRKREASHSILLISSLGVLILLESAIQIIFGADVKTIDYLEISKGINILGALITPLQISIIATSIIVYLGLYVFMEKSRLGKATRATSINKDVAQVVGISSERIYAWNILICSLLAGIAGIFLGLEQKLEPGMGTRLTMKAFAAVVIGGTDYVYGAIGGALILGLIETLSVWFLPAGFKDAIAFSVLFIFLLFRPEGLFRVKREGEKK